MVGSNHWFKQPWKLSIQGEVKGVADTLDGQARWIINLNAIFHFEKFQIGVFHEYYSE